jgi:hypothetical protein
MNFFELILENRVDDFKNKYRTKFTSEQIYRIIKNVQPKFLNWVGKNFETINFDNNFQLLLQTLKDFDKKSSNLPLTDINAYKSFSQLVDSLKEFSTKARRQYKKIGDAVVVHEDDKYLVVNPQTHDSSCYYGKGTKWCTAATTDDAFNRYNIDGKLFYFLDKTKSTSDLYYKIALLKKFTGEEFFYDAKDQTIKNIKDIFDTTFYNDIMSKIKSYLEQEYSEQIKIFTDKELARKEKERLESLRIQRLEAQRREEANERRINNEWEIGPNCPDEGLEAHALLEYLENMGDVGIKTNEDVTKLSELEIYLSQLNDRQTELEAQGGDLTSIFAEIEVTEDQINEINQKIDVYNIIPIGNYYDCTRFSVIDSEFNGQEFAVGDEDEMKSSCVTALEELLDDVGYEGFSKRFVRDYLDERKIMDLIEEHYNYDVNDNPDVYFDESERNLSNTQELEIEKLETRISKVKDEISNFEEHLDTPMGEFFEKQIEGLESIIEDLESEINDIRESPDGDFSSELIEERVEALTNQYRRDPSSFLDELGIEVDEYIDRDALIEGVIEADGYGHTLNRFNGETDEYKIDGVWYYVMRID